MTTQTFLADTCHNCGEKSEKFYCPHCQKEYELENNERYDRLKPLDIETLDKAAEKVEKIKKSIRDIDIFNQGI